MQWNDGVSLGDVTMASEGPGEIVTVAIVVGCRESIIHKCRVLIVMH